jgi:DNA repair protein RadC
MTRGGNSLTNAELLALLIGSGSADESAVELGQKIMVRAGKTPAGLKNLRLLHGMGVAKSCSILAAVELARRLYDCPPPEFKTVYLIRNPDDELPFFGS